VADSLLDQIERDALDESASVATALRKCVALGGRSGSQALRDWATQELDGYYGSKDMPEYRVVQAAIQLDGMTATAQIQGQAVPPSVLPEPACGYIEERVELRDGIGQIEDLARRSEIKLGLPGGGNLVRLMNAESGNRYQHIDRLYWAVSPIAVRGVVDQVRNSLVKLVAEIRASTPAGQELPSEEVATQAMNFVISGKRAKVTLSAAQARGSGPQATVTAPSEQQSEPDFWTTSRRIGAAVVGLATIAGAVFAAIQVF
jgi:hypothetical protein